LKGEYDFTLPRKWPIAIYEAIANLSLINPDIRQAVGHIVQLGNTGHLLSVKGESDTVIEAAVQRIRDRADVMYPFGGGPDGLINGIFAQVARMGAISTEWVPTNNLSGIDKVFFVPVRDIRWVPRQDGMGYYPVQVPRNTVLALDNYRNAVKLNLKTYFYANAETIEDSPYAVPPFIAALQPVALQQAMLRNINKVIKKVGIMGLMTYKVTPPKQNPGENQDRYTARCLAYLNQVTDNLKTSFGDGIAAGFQGAFEFDVKSVTSDVRGINDLFKMNEEQLFSAIMADPAMHGRTYSTTETYASVVHSKMVSQLTNYQRLVGKSLDFGWGLDLLMAGITAQVCVGFNESQALSNLQKAQAEMIDIANAEALYNGGVIDQTEKANRLGYAVPDQAEPRVDPNAQDKNLDQRPSTGGKTDNTPKNPKKKQPKEQASVQFAYNKEMKQYYFKRDTPIEVLNTLRTDAGMPPVSLSKQEDELKSKYRRYL